MTQRGLKDNYLKMNKKESYGLLPHKLLSLPDQTKSHNDLFRLQSGSEIKNESLVKRFFPAHFLRDSYPHKVTVNLYFSRRRTNDLSDRGSATFPIETDS